MMFGGISLKDQNIKKMTGRPRVWGQIESEGGGYKRVCVCGGGGGGGEEAAK